MPPKQTAAPAVTSYPLQDISIFLCGKLAQTQPQLQEKAYKLGADITKSIGRATHVITNEREVEKNNPKIAEAQSRGIPILNVDWLDDAESSNTRLSDTDAKYVISIANTTPASSTSTAAATTIPNRSAAPKPVKRKQEDVKKEDEDDLDSTVTTSASGPDKKAKFEPVIGEAQIAKSSDLSIPLDDCCPYHNYRVYVDPDGVIWDATLNQTNSGNNNNKFYRLQVLSSNTENTHLTWSRWGRVGQPGQSKALGQGALGDAISQFQSKFKDKSGLLWSNRTADPKSGKYAFIEKNYDLEDDDEEVADAGNGNTNGSATNHEKRTQVACTLAPEVQVLLKIIFNKDYINANMADLNYDNSKMPLGRLSRATIMRGFQTLKDLSALLDDPALAQTKYDNMPLINAVQDLSNRYYSLIPHIFGHQQRPPVIDSQEMIKREVELMDSLTDMKESAAIMRADLDAKMTVHALDRQFQGLNLKEMSSVATDTQEFQLLKQYLMGTRGGTHSMQYNNVDAIFRIERNDEFDRFEKSEYGQAGYRDRRLLWHGSRATNFGGILSQGLRIAPPEAPVSGYMFDKGVYLADMSTKSANYCCAHLSGNTALLLLCEAELGSPMQTLTGASSCAGATAKAANLWSTWGQGITAPKAWKDAGSVHPSLENVKMPDTTNPPGNTGYAGTYLQYNEYICYDVAQIRLRYLFQVSIG